MNKRQLAELCDHFAPTTLANIVLDLEPYSTANVSLLRQCAMEALIANVGEDEAELLIEQEAPN